MELRGMRESDLRGLLGHGAANFWNAVADADDGGLAGGVKKTAAIRGNDPAALAADGDRKRLFEIAGEKSAVRGHEISAGEL